MADNCERCGGTGPIIEVGPFAGSTSMLDYCNHCFEDLCDNCMKTTECEDSPDGHHLVNDYSDEDDED